MHAVTSELEHPFRHPALGAALAARNAVSAEMAVAGRARHDPGDRTWATALGILEDHAEGDVRGAHADRLMRLSTRLGGAGEAHAPRSVEGSRLEGARRPAARRRRERLETAFWFAVGGAGGLMLAFGVRMVEVMVAWR